MRQPPPRPFPENLVPATNWHNLPQRIAEGICVGLAVGFLIGLFRVALAAFAGR